MSQLHSKTVTSLSDQLIVLPAVVYKIVCPQWPDRKLIENLFDILSYSSAVISVPEEKIKWNATQN
jgi:hypothetical protein